MIDDRFQILPSDDEDKTYVQLDGEVYYIDEGDEEDDVEIIDSLTIDMSYFFCYTVFGFS